MGCYWLGNKGNQERSEAMTQIPREIEDDIYEALKGLEYDVDWEKKEIRTDFNDVIPELLALLHQVEKEARIEELKKLGTPKLREINRWSLEVRSRSKQGAFIQGARFMRNRIQKSKAERIEALKALEDTLDD